MIQTLERYFKTALVDKSPSISSAALVSSYHLYPSITETINRWANQVNEALIKPPSSSFSEDGSFQSTSAISQYHALGLLYSIRHKDRMAVTKLVQSLAGTRNSLRNPLALCMLIRYCARLMDQDTNIARPMLELLEGWLRNKSDMVSIEAARAICEWSGASAADLMRPVAVLQLALSTPKTPLKFAAIRTLNKLAQSNPLAVSSCNLEIENLITDSNRSIATFAITTLLKTGNEASVDRLMKQISSFMLEISDEFKVIVVDAVRTLCLKFPVKYPAMLAFLSQALRDEGGYDFKRSVVEAIIDMIKFIAESKEVALSHLCEFIEDCEFTKLSVRVLHLLGVEGPKTLEPTKYIRHIYNRVVLENAIVRAAAVSSLAKFGTNVMEGAEHVRRSVKVLLGRCLDDTDDEVRDRAAMYMRIIQDDELANKTVKDAHTYSITALEGSLSEYVGAQAFSAPFDTASIPLIDKDQICVDTHRPVLEAAESGGNTETTPTDTPAPPVSSLTSIPEFATFGPLLYSSAPVELTESETEYVVQATKHIFAQHVVFEFHVYNSIPEAVLEGVSVLMSGGDEIAEQLHEDFILPIAQLTTDMGRQSTFVSYSILSEEDYPVGAFANTLTFTTKEVDPDSGEIEAEGYKDEYQVEDVELVVSDYIRGEYSALGAEWDAMPCEVRETFNLTAMDSLQGATDELIKLLGMLPLGGTEHVSSTHVHSLHLSGKVVTGAAQGKVLAQARMVYEEQDGVTLELGVKSDIQAALELVIGAIQ